MPPKKIHPRGRAQCQSGHAHAQRHAGQCGARGQHTAAAAEGRALRLCVQARAEVCIFVERIRAQVRRQRAQGGECRVGPVQHLPMLVRQPAAAGYGPGHAGESEQ
jgi:hypothetical protein